MSGDDDGEGVRYNRWLWRAGLRWHKCNIISGIGADITDGYGYNQRLWELEGGGTLVAAGAKKVLCSNAVAFVQGVTAKIMSPHLSLKVSLFWV
ncbi:MAG: hypothetical protein ACYDG4_05805 [Desulfuromonadaceae bacterium]